VLRSIPGAAARSSQPLVIFLHCVRCEHNPFSA